MRLHNRRRATLALGPDPEPPRSPFAALTQVLYLLLLAALVGYIAWLSWGYATRLEMRGQVNVQTRVLGAPRGGQVSLRVARGDRVDGGDALAVIDPQLDCAPSLLEDRRLEELRHRLRVARAREEQLAQRLQRLRQRSPAEPLQRALELDGSRGDPLLRWQERVEALGDERELARVERESLQSRRAEILAQASVAAAVDPACLPQTLRAPMAGDVVALRRRGAEFVQRGEPLLLFRDAQPAVWIEVFADADELALLRERREAQVRFADGYRSAARLRRVESAAADEPALLSRDYVPVTTALRAVLEPAQARDAARWRDYARMEVEVTLRR